MAGQKPRIRAGNGSPCEITAMNIEGGAGQTEEFQFCKVFESSVD
jgi:hypothetical protein